MAAGVRRIVHVSSITVHGNDVRGEADENSPLRSEPNPYSRSKVAGEKLLQRMIRDEGAPVTIVRPGWIYGPGDTASFARIARMIDEGRMIMVGSGENHLPLIYVRDVAQGVLLAYEAEQAAGRSYLLVNDEPVTQRGFLATIAAELGASVPTRRIPYGLAMMLGGLSEHLGHLTRRRQPPPVMRYGLQLLGGENRFVISRARHELGFSPLTGLAEGVRHSAQLVPRLPGAWPREDPGMSTILLTGGNGFVGRHVVSALQERGDRVRVLALPGENAAGSRSAASPSTTAISARPNHWRSPCAVRTRCCTWPP